MGGHTHTEGERGKKGRKMRNEEIEHATKPPQRRVRRKNDGGVYLTVSA